MLQGASLTLCFSGLALFALALLNGFAIPALKSPRIGLSAHLTGLQSGTFLVAAGLMWDRISMWRSWSAPLAYALAVTLALIWISLVLAAVFGAGRELPIAGQGVATTRARQGVVTILMATGSFGLLAVVVAVLTAMILA